MEISDAALVLIGRTIYDEALSDRQGFRADQIGIEDDEVWAEIYEAIALVAVRAVAPAIRAAAMEDAAVLVETHTYTVSNREPAFSLQPSPRAKDDMHHRTIAAAIRSAKEAA